MEKAQVVPEVDVLVAVATWLHGNSWVIEQVSPPRPHDTERVGQHLESLGIPPENVSFTRQGEDIRARQGDTVWRIECKGLSDGTPQTDRNNLDRAVASAVLYYTQATGIRLGLAVPEWYYPRVQTRLPLALCRAVNMWVLLYVASDEVYVLDPHHRDG